jgi:hypothetical protein
MLLTKTEQEKIQSYVIKNMIENQQSIRNQVDEVDSELLFIDCMIEKKYKQAFTNICENFICTTDQQFMVNVINFIQPNVNKNWAKYNSLEALNLLDDVDMYDNCLEYNMKEFYKLPNIIFD